MFTERNKNKFGKSPNEILIRCLEKDDFTEWNEWRIWGCDFDELTVFSGEGLSKARIEPRLMEHMKKNIRRVKF